MTFQQEIILALVQTGLPIIVLIFGGRWVLNRYEISKKKREQELELARFIRERQYEALEDLYAIFSEFMALYRIINHPDTILEDDHDRTELLRKATIAESQIDALILRIASEFSHKSFSVIEDQLGNLRQSVQIFREQLRKKAPIPFYGGNNQDYIRFKTAFAGTAAYLGQKLSERLEQNKLDSELSQKLILGVFDNKHEWHGKHL